MAEIEEFDPGSVTDRRDPRIRVLETAIDGTLVDVFGANTLDYRRYQRAKSIDRATHYVNRATGIGEVIEGLRHGKERR
jgi:hypothetical protein